MFSVIAVAASGATALTVMDCARQLPGQRLRQADDAGLGRAVVGLADRADEARGGGDVDDAPGAVDRQVRQRRLADDEAAARGGCRRRGGSSPPTGPRTSPGAMAPALLTRMCSVPPPSSAACCGGFRRRRSSRARRGRTAARCRLPAVIDSAVATAASLSMSVTSTAAPAAANARATASPMPPPAPVTSAERPSSRKTSRRCAISSSSAGRARARPGS